ncbi:hypothetical protein [Actinophytocola sp.]
MAHEDLFREPEFAPGTPTFTADEPAPIHHRQYDVMARPRRTTRHHRAA